VNQALPDDVAVRAAEPCEARYQPRFDAIDKTYRYTLSIDAERDPLLRHRAWRLPPRLWHPAHRDAPMPCERLDLPAMREAASHLVGTHDFRAFRAADDDRAETTRTLHEVRIVTRAQEDPRLVTITVRGSAFMKNMVRILVGTLVEVGRGRIAAHEIPSLLGPEASRAHAGPTAPPEGLTLLEVRLGRSVALGSSPTETHEP
jgi:tRNA pseudouridine38-40 synthase